MRIHRYCTAFGLGLAFVCAAGQAAAADRPQAGPAGVGPNGEVNGLTARFMDVDGVRTRYYEYGQGEPLVLLHGGGVGGFYRPRNNANVWGLNIPDLAKRFHVLVPDRIGAGLTDIPRDYSQLTREGDANHVYEFIRAKGLTQVHLAGHSGGGSVAMTLALRHPEMVKTLVLVSNSGDAVTPLALTGTDNISRIREWACRSLADTDEMLAWRCWCNVMSGNPALWDDAFFEASWEMYNRPRQREIQAHLVGGAGESARQRERPADRSWSGVKERLGTNALKMPVLYVQSANDTSGQQPVDEISGMQRALGFYNILSAASDRVLMIVYDTGGHFPYRQYPERFNYDVAQFIAYWGSGTGGR